MKFLRNYDDYNKINESTFMVGDGVYRVKSSVDVNQSVINAYVKKVKSETGKDLRQYYSDIEIAEELVKLSTSRATEIENVDARAMIGAQAQPQAQPQVQPQVQPQAQPEPQAQFDGEFIEEEEKEDAQAQSQDEVENTESEESEDAQAEVEGEFEDAQAEDSEEEDSEEEDLDSLDDLPL